MSRIWSHVQRMHLCRECMCAECIFCTRTEVVLCTCAFSAHVFICATWLIQICVFGQVHAGHTCSLCTSVHPPHMCSYVWHDSFIYVWHDSFIYVCILCTSASCCTCVQRMHLPKIYSRAWACGLCDAFMCLTGLKHVLDMVHVCMWLDAYMCVAWRIHVCALTLSWGWYDTCVCLTWHIYVCEPIHMYTYTYTYIYICTYI